MKLTLWDVALVAGTPREFLEARRIMQGSDKLLQRQLVKVMNDRDMTPVGVWVFRGWYYFQWAKDRYVKLRDRVRHLGLPGAGQVPEPVIGPVSLPGAKDKEPGVLRHFPHLADVAMTTQNDVIMASSRASDSKVWLDGSIEKLAGGLGYRLLLISYTGQGVSRVQSKDVPLLADIWQELSVTPVIRGRLQQQAVEIGWMLRLPGGAAREFTLVGA